MRRASAGSSSTPLSRPDGKRPRGTTIDPGLEPALRPRQRSGRGGSGKRRGFVKQYQVNVDPTEAARLQPLDGRCAMAVKRSNGEVGGRSSKWRRRVHLARAAVTSKVPGRSDESGVGVGRHGSPVLLGGVANVRIGPDMRRGIAELNGEGETVGGIVVVRYGENARQVIVDVKKTARREHERLPAGRRDVPLLTTAARSLIAPSRRLKQKLIEEMIVVVAASAFVFLHLRGARSSPS